MKKIIAFIWFLLPVILMAQSTNVDSLVNVLNTKDLIESEKLALYYKIFNGYVYNNPEEASKYAERGIALAKKENDKRMLSNFHAAFGILYNTKSDYETALEYWEKALHWAEKAKDKELEANAYMGIGVLYARQGIYISAVENLTAALSIYESTDDKEGCIITMGNLASLHRAMENNEKAIYYLEKAKTIAEETHDDIGKMQTYFELGVIYSNPEIHNKDEKKIKMALEYAQKAYEISCSLHNKSYQAASAEAMAVIYYDYLEDYDMALKYANETLRLTEELGDPMRMRGAAMKHINQDSREIIVNMETKYETEKKETRIAVLEKEQKLYAGLGVALLVALLSVIGLFIYRHRLAAQEKTFIAIQASLKAEKTERDLIAHDLHDSVSSLLTVVKNNLNLYSASEYKETSYFNNALKHSGASRIDVHLNMDEQTVYLSVADNGSGFDFREMKPGIGLENIRSNLSAFGGQLDILSEPGKGTEANIEMEV